MKRWLICTISLLFFIFAELSAPGPSKCIQQANVETELAHESPCWQKAFTQLAMNECAKQDLREADAKLNSVYQQVLSKYANDANRIARIKKAQRAWIAFRDAEIEALFPGSEEPQHGSAWVMCRPLELAKLITERTKGLKPMLEHREGDVCSQ